MKFALTVAFMCGGFLTLGDAQNCGIMGPRQRTFVLDGSSDTLDFPWHATLYTQKNMGNKASKEYRCGATIIRANLLLTAAHCVYDEYTETNMDPENLFVLTGNTDINYDSPLHDLSIVKKGAVKNIHVHCQYSGTAGNYAWDIALLELKEPFKLSSTLLPACLDDDGSITENILNPGAIGRLISLGKKTSASPSTDTLSTKTLSYITYRQCITSPTGSSYEFLTQDKFCTKYTDGEAIGIGDSGSGLVFKKNEQWYVLGIASIGLGVDLSSDGETSAENAHLLFTKVPNYSDWIRSAMRKLDQHQSLESCN